MKIEYEATFEKIDKDSVRSALKDSGAELVKEEFLQKRSVFLFPKGHEVNGGWIRVRDEGDKMTMSVKVVDGNRISDQKEIQLKIDDFNQAVSFLQMLGCTQKSYQETKRELWILDGCEVTIDEWPFLEPFVEIEGRSEESVKSTSEKLGFDYSKALFCAVDELYSRKYGVPHDTINNKTPRIVFGEGNPFLKQ